MKIYLKALFITGLIIFLVACGNSNTEPSHDQTNEIPDEPFAAEELPKQFLDGNLKAIYNQTSDLFQENVSWKEFEGLGEDFNEGVQNYELMSKISFENLVEYQWINNEGDKGIQASFADDNTIEGLLLAPMTSYPETDEKYTENTYQMPITREWLTYWGGTNELVNYHYVVESQRYAYDLLIFENDATHEGDPKENESYYAFGEDIIAPQDGVVVSTENDIEVNTPTVDTNEENPLGNHVILEHEHNEYSVIAHFQKGTVKVNEGDSVHAGDVLGLVGNSGNSSEPHIHFHVADDSDWEKASSIRIKFENGEDPVRGDLVEGF